MRNGSRSEYYLVEGGLKMTRVRQSEWRRRWGVQGIIIWDGQVAASADDGFSRGPDNEAYSSDNAIIVAGEQGNGQTAYDSWARFTNVTIPGGATIVVAYITVEAQATGDDGEGVKTNIAMNDIDTAVNPTTRAEHEALARTTAFTAWDDEDFVVDAPTNSPSIVDAVQEVIDRGSWSSGNSLMVLWDDDSTPTTELVYRIHSYDGSSSQAMKLHIEYSA